MGYSFSSGVRTFTLNLVWVVLLLLQTGMANAGLPLEKIQLPPGFEIEIYATDVENARQMVRGDNGVLFVGSRRAGNVYALSDTNGDGAIDQQLTIAKDLKMPSGLAFRQGDLYVGAVESILRFPKIESRLDAPVKEVLSEGFPDKTHHGWKYLGFGPDGWLYVPVGAPCNICDDAGFAEIRRLNIDTGEIQTYANGVRNSVGMDWHPANGSLWFTDNGRDHMGDDMPADELNFAPKSGLHFGYPYCHQGDTLDPEFGKGKSCANYQVPAHNLGAHVAALGMKFYTGKQFPDEYQQRLFIVERGSWNRSSKVGYRIVMVKASATGVVTDFQVFASGWLQGEEAWGRLNDVLVLPDGSLLVSDDKANVIYRIFYNGADQ